MSLTRMDRTPTRHTEEVINGCDVVHGVSEDADLLLPLLLEQVHVVLGNFTVGLGSQSQGRVNHLQSPNYNH